MTDLLTVDDLCIAFPEGTPWRRRLQRVVHHVSFSVKRGEIVGLIGESGSGKSTIARAIMGLTTPEAGRITLNTGALSGRSKARQVQMIFQDPLSSLDPRMSAGAQIGEVMHIHRHVAPAERTARVATLLDRVGLPPSIANKLPRMMSGGQRARVGIARALAAEPDLIVADEATAALDLSIQAQIVNLLLDLKEDLGLSLLFITHDLPLVRLICDRAVVLQSGRVMEAGATEKIFSSPQTAYTRDLLAACAALESPRG